MTRDQIQFMSERWAEEICEDLHRHLTEMSESARTSKESVMAYLGLSIEDISNLEGSNPSVSVGVMCKILSAAGYTIKVEELPNVGSMACARRRNENNAVRGMGVREDIPPTMMEGRTESRDRRSNNVANGSGSKTASRGHIKVKKGETVLDSEMAVREQIWRDLEAKCRTNPHVKSRLKYLVDNAPFEAVVETASRYGIHVNVASDDEVHQEPHSRNEEAMGRRSPRGCRDCERTSDSTRVEPDSNPLESVEEKLISLIDNISQMSPQFAKKIAHLIRQ